MGRKSKEPSPRVLEDWDNSDSNNFQRLDFLKQKINKHLISLKGEQSSADLVEEDHLPKDAVKDYTFHKIQDFENWLENIYNKRYLNTHERQKQMAQLFRDILFELENPPKENQYAILLRYMDIAPDRMTLPQLLQLKPMIMPTADIETKESDSRDYAYDDEIKELLDELYSQIKSLAKSYPRESKLLAQITDNLKQAAIILQEAKEADQSLLIEEDSISLTFTQKRALMRTLGNFHLDPRYISLHKHRGFHKITEWFAEVCVDIKDFFEKLFKTKPAPKMNYRHIFFYKDTHSVELVDKLAKTISDELIIEEKPDQSHFLDNF